VRQIICHRVKFVNLPTIPTSVRCTGYRRLIIRSCVGRCNARWWRFILESLLPAVLYSWQPQHL